MWRPQNECCDSLNSLCEPPWAGLGHELCDGMLHTPSGAFPEQSVPRSTALQEEMKHERAQQHETELQRQMAAHEEAALAERAARAAEARSVLVRTLLRAGLTLRKQPFTLACYAHEPQLVWLTLCELPMHSRFNKHRKCLTFAQHRLYFPRPLP